MDWWWRRQLADDGIDALIHDQGRIVSRAQLQAAGWSEPRIRQGLRSRRWQTVHPGVYSTHTGPIGYDEQLLAALLYAGPNAAWSHYTAAEQLGLLKPDSNRGPTSSFTAMTAGPIASPRSYHRAGHPRTPCWISSASAARSIRRPR